MVSSNSPYLDLLCEFPHIVTPDFNESFPPGMVFVIGYLPGAGHFKPTLAVLVPDNLKVAREEFSLLERISIIRPSPSEWASLLTYGA